MSCTLHLILVVLCADIYVHEVEEQVVVELIAFFLHQQYSV